MTLDMRGAQHRDRIRLHGHGALWRHCYLVLLREMRRDRDRLLVKRRSETEALELTESFLGADEAVQVHELERDLARLLGDTLAGIDRLKRGLEIPLIDVVEQRLELTERERLIIDRYRISGRELMR